MEREEDHGSDDCPSVPEDDVQKHTTLQQCSSRKRESSSTDECPSAIRRCINSNSDDDVQKPRIAYDNLVDPELQRCFLFSALFVRKCKADLAEYSIETRILVKHLVDVGVIARMNTMKEELLEARTMLSMLLDAGLLKSNFPFFVGMDEAIRNTALQIMGDMNIMIKNDMSLKELPDEECWTRDILKVSLQGNQIENIPLSFSPRCSKITMLLLNDNDNLRCIADSFFEAMPLLKVLDLSGTSIESLPTSVCSLVNLISLLLSWCTNLKKIPSVKNLRALKKLDLRSSGVEQVPEDIEILSKLTYLDLFGCSKLEKFESRTFAKLFGMQFLKLHFTSPANGGEFACLSRLETLTCSFYDVFELNKYLILLKWYEETEPRPRPPLVLHVQVCGDHQGRLISAYGHIWFDDDDEFAFDKDGHWSMVGFHNCNISEVDLQNYFQEIVIENCSEARSLCNFSQRIKGVSKLKHISVTECLELEMLFSLSFPAQNVLENIEYMHLRKLENLCVLVRKGGVGRGVPYGSCFSNLTRFVIQKCPSIKRLFPLRVLQNLKKLKRLYVIDCPLMEEIFGHEEDDDEGEEISIARKKFYYLSGLCALRLADLPELKRICGGQILCGVPQSCSARVEGCPNLAPHGLVRYPRMSKSMPSMDTKEEEENP